jgi:uncharacterized membrane protein
MTRRITGYIFIILAIILAIIVIGLFPKVFETLIHVTMIFTGRLEGYQIGVALGHFIYWVFHFALTITLWNYGRKWIKKKVTTTQFNG